MKFDQLHDRFQKIKEEWNTDTQIDFQFKNKQYTEDLAKLECTKLELGLAEKLANWLGEISQLFYRLSRRGSRVDAGVDLEFRRRVARR